MTYRTEGYKKKSIFLHLTEIIGKDPHWQWPLNGQRLDELLDREYPKDEVNNFKNIFWYTILKMKESGVEFSSPGNSYGRKFCYWFNSHFWREDFMPMPFEKEEYLFSQAFEIVKIYCNIPINLKEELVSNPKVNELIILGGNALSRIGKVFLFSLSPINELFYKRFN